MPGKFDAQNYIDVQDRINRFWSEHPDGAIDTDVTYSPDFEHVVITAKVYKHRDDTRPSASGIAGEMKSGMGANQTSWHENGETSAIGRALANMGYATSLKDRPSKQEMQKVTRQAGEIDDRAVSQRPAPRHDAPQTRQDRPRREEAPAEASDDPQAVMRRLHAALARHGITHDDLHDYAARKWGVASVAEADPRKLATLARWASEQDSETVQGHFAGVLTQQPLTGDPPERRQPTNAELADHYAS